MEKYPMAQILGILIPLLMVGFTIWFFMRMRRPRKSKVAKVDQTTRQERAVWAWANITSSTQGPISSFGVAHVDLELEVHLPGTPAYPAKVSWLVDKDSLGFVEVGKEIALKVDPQGPQYIYPNGSWAKFVE
jgi:hypothetical protein